MEFIKIIARKWAGKTTIWASIVFWIESEVGEWEGMINWDSTANLIPYNIFRYDTDNVIVFPRTSVLILDDVTAPMSNAIRIITKILKDNPKFKNITHCILMWEYE
jgi:hypothetical protein